MNHLILEKVAHRMRVNTNGNLFGYITKGLERGELQDTFDWISIMCKTNIVNL